MTTTEAPAETPPLPSSALEHLVRRLADTQSQIAELQEIESALKNGIRALAPVGSQPVAGLKLVVSQSRRFDAAAAQLRYPAERFPAFYPPSFDAKVCKANTPPAEIDELMVATGEPSVSLK